MIRRENHGERRVMVCFDYEGHWGMPHPYPYDLARATDQILELLARHDLTATFFAVADLVRTHPAQIRAIAGNGHEIGLHGVRHERLDDLRPAQLAALAHELRSARASIEDMAGAPVTGFRAPYLLGPHFHRADVYETLEALGFRWTSNREVRCPIEIVRPDRLPVGDRLWKRPRIRGALSSGPVFDTAVSVLNAGLCVHDRIGGSVPGTVRWLVRGTASFHRGALLEIPVAGPLDCDLLGFPSPQTASTEGMRAYAAAAIATTLTGLGTLRMLTFHDWIISGGNRLSLLEHTASAIRQAGLTPTLGRHLLAEAAPQPG